MMELIPTRVDGAVLFNLRKGCRAKCSDCGDLSVSMHNLLLTSGLKYVIVDLQDEKHICDSFTEELVQLWKRLNIPFLFAGVIPDVEKILKRYGYLNHYKIYLFGEEAISDLKTKEPSLFDSELLNIVYDKPMVTPRSRAIAAGEDPESEDEEN